MSINSVSIRMAEASSTVSTGHQENQMVLNGQHANHLKAQPPLKMLDPLEVYAQTKLLVFHSLSVVPATICKRSKAMHVTRLPVIQEIKWRYLGQQVRRGDVERSRPEC
ncbi:hypothetical protein OUZ56_031511 [Daphnia magna]|uniref:Uncharacterized protein n=1 Tax=Daphnia magna TaxID=35525 RepID=A0ABQ9ZVJ5_9CRUS|nr:hypothetical protein OUZ56_031511 [Daphnia magna]